MPNFFLSNWSVCKFCLASKWAVFVFTSVAIPKPLVRYTSLYAILSVALVNLLVRNIYVYIFLFSIVSLSQVKLHICELVLSEKKRNWRVWRTCSEFTPISAMLVFSLLHRRGWWETPVLLPSNLKPHASRQQFSLLGTGSRIFSHRCNSIGDIWPRSFSVTATASRNCRASPKPGMPQVLPLWCAWSWRGSLLWFPLFLESSRQWKQARSLSIHNLRCWPYSQATSDHNDTFSVVTQIPSPEEQPREVFHAKAGMWRKF